MGVRELLTSSLCLNASPSTGPAMSGDVGIHGDFPHGPTDVDEEWNLIPGEKLEGLVIPLLNSNEGTEILVRKLTGGEVALK